MRNYEYLVDTDNEILIQVDKEVINDNINVVDTLVISELELNSEELNDQRFLDYLFDNKELEFDKIKNNYKNLLKESGLI